MRARTLSDAVLISAVVAAAAGCADTTVFMDAGPADSAPIPELGPTGDAYVNPCAPGPPPAVAGKVFAPNGTDPVAGASVFVPLAVKPLPAEVQCESCAVAGQFAAVTYTAADGSFRLQRVPNGTFKLGLQKGYFRRIIEVTVPECGELELTPDQGRLPGANEQYGPWDTVPRIAVVTGVWDRLEKVLDKLGVQQKTIFNGKDQGTGPESAQSLLENAALLRSFHMVFVNCGTRFEGLIASPGPGRNAVAEYVRRGGRLFVSDLSYDFAEQVFPPYVDYQGSDDIPVELPEEPNAAELGSKDLTIRAEVLDAQLRAWLALPGIDALLPDGTVELLGFKTGWAVAKEGQVDLGVKTWVQGPAVWAGGSGMRPLTLSYDMLGDDGGGCGRVVFSSYHTWGDAPVLLAQERILEYLMLEMGTCIELK